MKDCGGAGFALEHNASAEDFRAKLRQHYAPQAAPPAATPSQGGAW